MTEAYADAACRHWSDAEHLHGVTRLPNADHLYGLAAECALKVVLLQIPACLESGSLQKRYYQHINELWELMPLQSVTRLASGLVPLLRMQSKPFSDWNVDQRYASGEATTDTILKTHRDAARRVLGAAGLLGERRGS